MRWLPLVFGGLNATARCPQAMTTRMRPPSARVAGVRSAGRASRARPSAPRRDVYFLRKPVLARVENMCHLVSMTTTPGAQDACDSLLDAATARGRLVRRTRWSGRYFLVFAAATAVLVPTVGLGGVRGAELGAAGFLAVSALMIVYAMRQGAVGAGWGRLHTAVFVTWGLLWVTTVVVGTNAFAGRAEFWLPAAVVDAAPFLAAGLLAGRRARS
jgi:hypothetical protein